MTFYDGLQFVSCRIVPHSSNRIERLLHDYYGIQYSQDGSLNVQVGEDFHCTVNGPCALITRPGVRFVFGPPPGTERYHAYVCFRGPRVEAYIQTGLLPLQPERPVIPIHYPEQFCAAIGRLFAMLQPLSIASHDRAVHEFEGLLLRLHEQGDSPPSFPEHLQPMFREWVKQLEDNPKQVADFRAIADALHLSYSHFRRLFKQFTGYAPGRFMMRTRMLRAAHQLESQPERQIKSIAAESGYNDYLYFSRMFRQYYGVSPQQYRHDFLG